MSFSNLFGDVITEPDVDNFNEILRDFGLASKKKCNYRRANGYHQRCVKLDPNEFTAHSEIVECKLREGEQNVALKAAERCLELRPNSLKAKYIRAKCVGELNRLENAFVLAHNILTINPKNEIFGDLKDAYEIALRRNMGTGATNILRKYKMHLDEFRKEREEEERRIALRLTLPAVRPLDEYRLKALGIKNHELYYDLEFADQFEFWKTVHINEKNEKLRTIFERIVNNLSAQENILYTREPIFTQRDKFDNKTFFKLMQRNFYLAQEDSRREALWQIRVIKIMKTENFKAALIFAERVLRDYYAVRPRAIFPAKFEYISELCTIIGSEYLKVFRIIPPDLMSTPVEKRLMSLFQVNQKTETENDYFALKMVYYTNRLEHSLYEIEKAYLCHQISELSFYYRRPEESHRFARDCTLAAKKSENNVWSYIGYFSMIRVDALKQNYLPIKEQLDAMSQIANNLNSFAQVFVRTAIRSLEDIQRKH